MKKQKYWIDYIDMKVVLIVVTIAVIIGANLK
jgi:hypothetical protein